MHLKPIDISRFIVTANALWAEQWFLLSAGDFNQRNFNAMTVSWGSLGEIWHKPLAQIFVRPTRFTFQFLEKHDTFTLCAFPQKFRNALNLLGSTSGRDGDKITASGLTPIASRIVAAPAYQEAELVIECRKIYWADFNPTHFLDNSIEQNYPKKDYHRIYFGEILAVSGTDNYKIS
ncbi:flavin reductase [candidate division KSB1 bacterium]|nr:flavin reductase [candidate division KSB1 bacterium]